MYVYNSDGRFPYRISPVAVKNASSGNHIAFMFIDSKITLKPR